MEQWKIVTTKERIDTENRTHLMFVGYCSGVYSHIMLNVAEMQNLPKRVKPVCSRDRLYVSSGQDRGDKARNEKAKTLSISMSRFSRHSPTLGIRRVITMIASYENLVQVSTTR